jgi:hypothetical protein
MHGNIRSDQYTGGESMSYEGSYDYTSTYARIVRAVCARADDSAQ